MASSHEIKTSITTKHIAPTIDSVDFENFDNTDASNFERENVHNIYDVIAPHFSGTRHRPWPKVDAFITSLPKGSLLADIGCGNGKYLNCNPEVIGIGCDISTNLVQICQMRGFNVVIGNTLSIPFSSGIYDAVISIAVLHHISTVSRRIIAIQELLRILKKGGKLLITVWAFEQEAQSRRKFTSQDVWVRWNTPNDIAKAVKKKHQIMHEQYTSKVQKDSITDPSSNLELSPLITTETETQRFYHVFVEGELEKLIADAGCDITIIDSVYDCGNWIVTIQKN